MMSGILFPSQTRRKRKTICHPQVPCPSVIGQSPVLSESWVTETTGGWVTRTGKRNENEVAQNESYYILLESCNIDFV